MVGLAAVKDLFFRLMEAYTCGSPEKYRDDFDSDAWAEYSTLGRLTGPDAIVNALQTEKDFDIHYTTAADVIAAENNENFVLFAKGHHFQAYRDGEFLYPVLWGGKYEFAVSKESGKIQYIKFYLEYEFGNTYLAKTKWCWKMYEETKGLQTSLVGSYQQYRSIVPETEKEKMEDCICKLLWDWDNLDTEACLKRVSDDIYVRVKLFEEVGPSKEYYKKEEFAQLIRDNFAYEDQSQMSVLFEKVEISEDGRHGVVHMKRYNPGKIVNKHVDVSTIHKLFFNMRFVARMEKAGDEWLVKEVNVTPINDVDALGFDFNEVRENRLNSMQSAFYR